MKSFSRWKWIIIGFTFLIMSKNVEKICYNESLQIIGNIICNIGALVSFVISVRTDDKLKFENIVNNKWILFSLGLGIIFFVIMVAFLCSGI